MLTRSLLLLLILASGLAAQERPNILWITSEDHGPHVGAYGDDYATTPVIDALAAKGMLYRMAWSNVPVCAPARTTIITGMYPTSLGAQHMRSEVALPAGVRLYPEYLREAGYYATNNVKEDYNIIQPGQTWDESSNTAHWRKRPAGKPFFSVFNFTQSHESQIRTRPHTRIHDPSKVKLPAYHPDVPEVREDWAQYYDKITEIDTLAGRILDELREDGLTEDTIVFFYADHGSGMPRSKRSVYNSGLQAPFVVYFPEKWRHLAPPDYQAGGVSDRLIGFVDLAPTVLSLAGIQPPAYMQGRAFAGQFIAAPNDYLFAFRGRMDERPDVTRAATDGRYIYIRQYMPHRIYGQHVAYQFETPTTAIWFKLFGGDKTSNAPQALFWREKPAEELYDLESDPDEIHNIAADPANSSIVARLSQALREWEAKIRDLGFLPENQIHSRSVNKTPYEMGHDNGSYPFERIRLVAEAASSLKNDGDTLQTIAAGFNSLDSAGRYWAAMGALMRKKEGVDKFHGQLVRALSDGVVDVRIPAAEALARHGTPEESVKALDVLVDLADPVKHGFYVAVAALNSLDYLDEIALPRKEDIAALPADDPNVPRKIQGNLPKLREKLLADLE
jgi:uncharacterized sulfatase